MRLRVRSMSAPGGGETIRLDVPATATLADVKALLAAKLAAPLPVPAESIRLSLNRSDELLSPNPSSTLPSLGLTSGDLVFFSISPLPSPSHHQTLAPIPTLEPRALGLSKLPEEAGSSSSRPQTLTQNPHSPVGPAALPNVEMVDAVEAKGSSNSVVGALKQEMESEMAGAEGSIICRLIVAAHAALLDTGFLTANPSGSRLRLPQDWASAASTGLTVKYTLPELVGIVSQAEEGKVVVLNYSVMGNFVTVYGYLPGPQPEVRRVCLESSKLVPLLPLDCDFVGRAEERGILELWRVLKDRLCLPLVFWLCLQNGLLLPPCFMVLPADLKAKIFEFVPGVDLARLECTCRELRGLMVDDKLWKKKYEMEFNSGCGEGSRRDRSWKQRFAHAWAVKVAANNKLQRRPNSRLWRYNPVSPYSPIQVSPHRFLMIGGDSDMFPAIGETAQGLGYGNQRRNVSLHCNLGGRRNTFL